VASTDEMLFKHLDVTWPHWRHDGEKCKEFITQVL